MGVAFDVGQTVAASLQAPTLFTLAADLREMRVNASIDESDLGSIRDGQTVSFRVDAYPTRTFTGEVEQVRLNPVVTQNVVVYAAIISAKNPALELKPGMTANLTIEVARRDDVLRVPSAALRFRPTEETLTALGQDPKAVQQTAKGGAASQSATAATGTVWTFDGGLHAAKVSTGVTDGVYTEVLGDALPEGAVVATRIADATAGASRALATSSPLMPQQGGGRRF